MTISHTSLSAEIQAQLDVIPLPWSKEALSGVVDGVNNSIPQFF